MSTLYIRTTPHPVILSLLFLQFAMLICGNFLFSTIAAYNEYIAQGEWWRLITSLFIHVDFNHFLSNSICLFILGQSIEKQLGIVPFSIIFLAAGMSGNFFSYLIMPLEYIHAGASGGIFGLLGAQLFILYCDYRFSHPKELLLISLTICTLLLFTFFNYSANPISHLAGLLIGGIFTPFLIKKTDGAKFI